MSALSRLPGLALVLALVPAVALSPPMPSVAAAPGAAAETVKIGLGGPFPPANAPSGDKIFGDQMRVGVEQAVADINGSGGLLGHKLRVAIGDDGSDPKRGVEVAKRFVKAGIKLVIGHFTSAVTVPASAVYAEAGVLDITPSANGALVTDRGLQTVFRTCGREDQQAGAIATFLLGRHFDRISLVHDRSPAGKALTDEVRKALTAAGKADAFSGSIADSAQNVGDLAGRIRKAETQIVVFGGGPASAALLARRLNGDKTAIPLIGGLALASDEFPNQAGASADGSMTLFPEDPQQRPAAADLLRRLKARKKETGAYVFYSYAAVEVIRQAAEATKSLDPARLAAHMHSGTTFQTVLGPIAFDAKGDPKTTDLNVYVWHKGLTGQWNFLTPAGS